MSDVRITQAQLLTLMRSARAQFDALLADLSPEERAAVGTLERWSARDLIVHVTSWQRRFTQWLAAAPQGIAPPPPEPDLTWDHEDELNARTFEANRTRSWEDVQDDVAEVYARLDTLLARFSDEELSDPTRYPTMGGPLARRALGNSYWHPLMHLVEFYRQRGQPERGLAVLEQSLRDTEGLHPMFRSTAAYNLACGYALGGQPEQAVSALREALALAPNLRDWSQQDSDLVSLREREDFKALVKGPAGEG